MSCQKPNRANTLTTLLVLTTLLLSLSATAQTNPPPKTEERPKPAPAAVTDPSTTPASTPDADTAPELERNGRVVISNLKEDALGDASGVATPNSNDLAPEIDRQITKFEVDRDRWLKLVREELERAKRGATEEERRRLRERLRDNLRLRWQAISDERKQEIQERARELRGKLTIDDVVKDATEEVVPRDGTN